MIAGRRHSVRGATLRWFLGMVLASLPPMARAQLPQPQLHNVFPAGGQIGRTIDVEIGGSDLDGAERLWFSTPGLTAERVEGQKFRVVISADTPIGQHDVRVVGKFGLSNPRTFVVGERPETTEQEPNDTPAQANLIPWNSVVNGRSNQAADVDYFAFDATAGRRILIDLSAFRIESRMDGWLRVFDPSGREIADVQDESELDPFLDLELPDDGRYVIQVQDVIYAGSNDHIYRMVLHDGSHIDAVIPRVVEPGAEVTLTLLGRNLGEVADPATSVNGRSLERKEVRYRMPERSALEGTSSDVSRYLPAMEAPRAGAEYRFRGPGGLSNPVFVAAAQGSVTVEREPNNAPPEAQVLTLPCDVSGVFEAVGDLDRYQFTAKKGETYWLEVYAERLGSPADPSLVVQKLGGDGQVEDLAVADDLPDPRNFPISTSTADAALRWSAPADGIYQVALSDLYGTQRGDVRFYYHLSLRPDRPDFDLFVVPKDSRAQPLGLTVRPNGRALAYAVVKRLDGLDAPIRIEPGDLPPGLVVEPAFIGPGQFQAPIVVTAADGAAPLVGEIAFLGRALSPDRKEILGFEPGRSSVIPEPVHNALPVTDVWGSPNGANDPFRLTRTSRGLPVAVIAEPAPLRVSAAPGDLVVGRQSDVMVTVAVDRAEGWEEPVQVEAIDLPPNVPAAKVTVDKGQTSAELKLTITDKVPPGVYTLVLRGTAPYSFKKSPDDQKETKVTLSEPSNPITITVHE